MKGKLIKSMYDTIKHPLISVIGVVVDNGGEMDALEYIIQSGLQSKSVDRKRDSGEKRRKCL